jgi:hypothetical protein
MSETRSCILRNRGWFGVNVTKSPAKQSGPAIGSDRQTLDSVSSDFIMSAEWSTKDCESMGEKTSDLDKWFIKVFYGLVIAVSISLFNI